MSSADMNRAGVPAGKKAIAAAVADAVVKVNADMAMDDRATASDLFAALGIESPTTEMIDKAVKVLHKRDVVMDQDTIEKLLAGFTEEDLVAAVASKVLKNKETARKLIAAIGDGVLTPEKEAKAAEILSHHDAEIDAIVLADELKKLADKLGISEKAARAAYVWNYFDETNKVCDLYEPGITYRGSLMMICARGDDEITAELYDLEPDSPRGPNVRVYITSKPGDGAWEELRKVAGKHTLLHAEIVFGDYWDPEDTWTRRIASFNVTGETVLTDAEVDAIYGNPESKGGESSITDYGDQVLADVWESIDMSTIDPGKVHSCRVERADLFKDGVILVAKIASIDGISADGECTIVLPDPAEDCDTTARVLLADCGPNLEIEVTFCDGFIDGTKVRRVMRLAFIAQI